MKNASEIIRQVASPIQPITTPKTVRACLDRLHSLDCRNENNADEIDQHREKIDFLRDEPDHYL
jgi:hypothetical protein